MKKCSKCGLEKELSEFQHRKNSPDGLNGHCKKCHGKYTKIWRSNHKEQSIKSQAKWKKANPDKVYAQRRRNNLKINYGLTLDQYDQMFETQGGVCAICGGTDPSGMRLAVDHNHDTRKVRGLLCSSCNTALGCLKESPELFIKALHYLITYKKKGLEHD